MARPLKRGPTHVMEEKCLRAFKSILPAEWIFREQNPDYGIDGVVEIVEGENVTNKVLWVQLKSTEKAAHSHGVIRYSIETKYLQHFLGCRLPVALVLWVSDENSVYCLFAQKYLQKDLSVKHPNWRKQKTITIDFPLDSRLENGEPLKAIATEGYFYIIQQQLSAKAQGTTTYWLDGIPKSDDEELKERMLKALECMQCEKYTEAIEQLEDLLRACTVSPTARMSVLLNLGIAYYSIGQNEIALKNYNALLGLVRKAKIGEASFGEAAALGNIGLVYRSKGDLDEALKYYEAALKIDQKVGYKQGEAADLGNIGVVYRNRGDLDEALKYYEAALKIDQKVGYKQGEANQLGNIGIVYANRGDLDEALKYLEAALTILDKTGLTSGRDIILEAINSIRNK